VGHFSPWTILMNMFSQWDSPHYLFIAKNWYVNSGDPANFIVFFPLYPVLIRLITVDYAYINLSALLISNVSTFVTTFYLFKLAKVDFDDGVAKKAVLFLSIFPTAFFFSAIYTESLFFALVISSFYYARVGKWSLAGFLSFFAALTRLAGLLLLPALIVEYLHQRGWNLRKVRIEVSWVLLSLAGFLVYLLINIQVTGNLFTFVTIERVHWYQTIDPLLGLNRAWLWATTKPYPVNITVGIAEILFAALGLATIIVCAYKRFRASYSVYMTLTWMLAVGTGWWISVPRYIMAMFPMFILFGLASRRKSVMLAIAVPSLALLCFFTYLFAQGGPIY
jgi:Gpi18-like mannosyltransferase